MSKSKFLIGSLIGAAAGVIAGILTAPKTDSESRQDAGVRADEPKRKATVRTKRVSRK